MCLLSTLLINMVLEVLARAMKEKQKQKQKQKQNKTKKPLWFKACIKKVKKTTHRMEENLAHHMYDMGLVSRIFIQ